MSEYGDVSDDGLFFRPVYIILVTFLPMICISLVCGLLVFFKIISLGNVIICSVANGLYVIIRFLLTGSYLFTEPSPRQYIVTHIFSHLLLLAFGAAALFIFSRFLDVRAGNYIYTFLFMPMKLLYYFGLCGRYTSALIMTAAYFAITFCFPLIPIFSFEKE